MASNTYKRLYAGYGQLGQATLAYTVPASTATVLKEVNVTQANSTYGAQAMFGSISGIAFDSSGNMYCSDSWGYIRKIAPDGRVTQFTAPAAIGNPAGIAIDSTSTYMYVCDVSGNKIRRVTMSNGTVTTIAGSGTATNTDNTTGTTGTINAPFQCCISPDGNSLYVTVTGTSIRKVDISNPVGTFALSTLPATVGTATKTFGIAIDSTGTWLYIARFSTSVDIIRQRISDGVVVAIVGDSTQTAGFTNSSTTSARFHSTGGQLVLDESGANPRIYYADAQNHAIRSIDFVMTNATTLSTSFAHTVAGFGYLANSPTGSASSVNGYPDTSKIQQPTGMTLKNGALYYGSAVSGGQSIWRTGLQDSYTARFAGVYAATGTAYYQEGNAMVNGTGYFSLYVVPSGESLDYGKHCRFRTVAIAPSEAFFAEINKSLQTGDKVYIEPLTPGLIFELSGLEVT